MAAVSFDICRGRFIRNIRRSPFSILQEDAERFIATGPVCHERRQRRSLSSSLHRNIQRRMCHTGPTSGGGLQNTAGALARSAKEKWHASNALTKFSDVSCSKLIDSLNIDVVGGVKHYMNKVPVLWSKSGNKHMTNLAVKEDKPSEKIDDFSSVHMSEAVGYESNKSDIAGHDGVVRIKETVMVTQEKILPIREAQSDSIEKHRFGKEMMMTYESVQTFYNKTELPRTKDSEAQNFRSPDNIVLYPIPSQDVVDHGKEGTDIDNGFTEPPINKVSTTKDAILKTAGAAVVGSQNLLSDVVKRFPKISYNIPASVSLTSRRSPSKSATADDGEENINRDTSEGVSSESTKTVPNVNEATTQTVNEPAQVKTSSSAKEGTRQAILKSAGAAVASSQNLISDVVNRFPKISYTIPTRDPISSQVASSKVDAKQTIVFNKAPRVIHERRTRDLAMALRRATGGASKLIRLENLCAHLAEYPETRGIACETGVIPTVLRMRERQDVVTREQAQQALALLGYIDPVKGRGVRILSLDGGGTRGLYTLELLRQLEASTGKRIPELFDIISGVSTGALLATLLVVNELSIDTCESMYKDVSKAILKQARVSGITQLIRHHSYYDSDLWEERLRRAVGDTTYLDAMKRASFPKVVAVSTIMNSKWTENFLFRNYEYPSGTCSRYMGSTKHSLWEAARASSAAPFYYKDYKLENHLHTDGGVLTNNPTGIAVKEARLLWPNDRLQCVVSLGTGRFYPSEGFQGVQSSALKDKMEIFVESATCTEDTHTILQDMLPPGTYFRFNPPMSEDFFLDEIRDEKWEQMNRDTRAYCKRNEAKISRCAKLLLKEKTSVQKLRDMAKLKYDKQLTSVFRKEKADV